MGRRCRGSRLSRLRPVRPVERAGQRASGLRFADPRRTTGLELETSGSVPIAKGDGSQVRSGLADGGRWIRTNGPATEKLPSSAPCGFRARLHQLGEALIRRGTKSSNPASSSEESSNHRFLPGVSSAASTGQRFSLPRRDRLLRDRDRRFGPLFLRHLIALGARQRLGNPYRGRGNEREPSRVEPP
jgi:hypothetical protein